MIEMCLLRTKIMPQSLPLDQKKEIIKVCITKIEAIYGEEFASLITGLVDFDPKQRKTASEIREMLQKNYGNILNLNENETCEAVFIDENKEESHVPYSHGNIKRHKNSAGNVDSFGELFEMEEEHAPNQSERLQKTLAELGETMKGLQEKWDKWFSVDLKEKFSIKADQRVTDDTVEDYLQDLHTALADLKTIDLPKISICFEGCNQITDTSLKQIGGIVNENFGSVEYLSLKFPNCQHITDKGMFNLVHNIQGKLRNLDCLSLNFSGCEGLTSEGFKQLITITKDSKILKKLSLNFKGCPKIDEDSKNWAKEQLGLLQKSVIQ